MDAIGGPRLLLRRPKPGALLGIFAFLAIAAAACGSGAGRDVASITSDDSGRPEATVQAASPADGDATPTAAAGPDLALSGGGLDLEALPSPDPEGDAGQQFAAAAASVEFDAEAFARITPGGPRNVDPRRFRQLLGRDQIVPIYDPLVVSAAEAGFTPNELVMGVALNGESRAYPVGMMRSREIANDELGGIPLLVTW